MLEDNDGNDEMVMRILAMAPLMMLLMVIS